MHQSAYGHPDASEATCRADESSCRFRVDKGNELGFRGLMQVRNQANHRRPQAEPTQIVVSDLTKRFGNLLVVDDVSFTVEPGRITGFLGPNGAGKTTTLRMLLGLCRPTSGSATFGGRAFGELRNPKLTVGATLDSDGFHPARSGRDHLRVQAMAARVDAGRVDEVLDLTGLAESARRRVGGYSLGMKQRLSLAECLLGDPPVLVLDEPTNGLDPAGIAWLRDFLRHQADLGKTILLSSHMLNEVSHLVDDVVVIDHGSCLRSGSMASWQGETESAVWVRTPADQELLALLESSGHRGETREGGWILVRGLETSDISRLALDAGLQLTHVEPYSRSLEQMFFELVGTERNEPAHV